MYIAQRCLVIFKFMHFISFYNFNTEDEDFKNKEQISSIKGRDGKNNI